MITVGLLFEESHIIINDYSSIMLANGVLILGGRYNNKFEFYYK